MALNVKKFACLVSFISATTGREFTVQEIEFLHDQVDNMPDQPMNYLHQDTIKQLHVMLEAMQDGRKIDAIRAHRQLTGYGIKDSKDIIEKYWDNTVSVEMPVDLQGRYRFERDRNTLRVIAIS